jgi:Spy/CpxP family protein refolding chaperone
MKNSINIFAAACLLAGAGLTHAQHKPYAGEHAREIKALSDEETRQYLAGAGMGYAKAAELNGYPGPMHVLELADRLALTPEQREKTKLLMDAHKHEARAIGARLVVAERELDALFRSRHAQPEKLEAAVNAASASQASYRLSHLETHRRMREMLSLEQIERYQALRGYGKH